MKVLLLVYACFIAFIATSQHDPIQYMRPNNKAGLHVFETTKADTISYSGFKVRIGGNFTQNLQLLTHENNALPVIEDDIDINALVPLTNGFNLAMANLNLDAQLADGIRLSLTAYLSSRHHVETWVKGGYIAFDKLGFLNSAGIDRLMEHVTIKLGDYEPDYGDQHYRRSDGGNAIFNPFVENYILDAFTTEIGGEIYYHTNDGFFAMIGLTNGQLDPEVRKSVRIDSMTGEINTYAPAFHGKLGYDKQVTDDLRVRLTGSLYTLSSSSHNTLYFFDRAGSNYFFVMENVLASSDGNAWSGRFNPQFTDQVTAFMVNPFLKYRGVELFGTYEQIKGRMVTEMDKRDMSQYALDLIYRFPADKEHFWIGGRFNAISGELPLSFNEITIRRFCMSAGWFLTNHILLKAEYVTQQYKDFPPDDIRFEGKFNGLMIQASIGF